MSDMGDVPSEQLKEQGEMLKKLASVGKLGATNQFPKGKLNPEDEGELRLAVGIEKENIIINFGKPVLWIGLPVDQARELAQVILMKCMILNGK